MRHWDYEKNKSIDPSVFLVSSTKRAFFKCEKGHNYDAQINSKLAKHAGCPVCANKIIIKGINDFGTIYPELLKKWDYKKNAGIDPYKYAAGSSKKVY